jgi:hypothetical protein
VLLSFEENYVDEKTYEELERGYREVRAMLTSMISKVTSGS